ncbi:MAG TPA: protein kinase [Phycisphaerae bacterium]|nr:protein kinase [Phycisphaerae bacterium]
MTQGSEQGQSAYPQRRVCVACPNCRQGYRISARLLGRRLICRHCHYEWRAQEVDPEEFRSGRLVGNATSQDSGTTVLPEELPPRAGSSSIAIDMSWAGRELGRYRVMSLLGQGGMGSVWRSHDATLRRDVALKILNKSRRNGGDAGGLNVELFLQEARAVAKLQHPSVVSIYEVVEDQGQVFLALELMEGGTLKEYVERYGKIPPRELFKMMVGPVRALALAHKRGIIHRDVKPGNLMFDDHSNLKLMDFGLAEVAQESASEKMKGKAVGSLGWIAPETARGLGTTAASDIYGMGLVMLYALAGKPWFQSKSRAELIALHQNPPPLELNGIKGLTPKGAAMLRKCLAVDQADRFLTADLLADAVQECAEEDPERLAKQRKNVALKVVLASIVSAVLAGSAAIYAYTVWLDSKGKGYMPPAQGGESERVVPMQYQRKNPPRERTEAPVPARPPAVAGPATQPSAGLSPPSPAGTPQHPAENQAQPGSPGPLTSAPAPSEVPRD